MAKSPARLWLLILGYVLLAVAVLGLITPVVDLLHKLTFHIEAGEDVVHWVLGIATLLIAYGVKDDGVLGTLSIVYGIVYLLVGAVGFFIGAPSSPVAGWHVGVADNVLHLALGVITLAAGVVTRRQAPAGMARTATAPAK